MSADRVTVDELVADARSSVRRLTPQETKAEMARGLTLVDIRSDAQRDADGLIPSASTCLATRSSGDWTAPAPTAILTSVARTRASR